MDHTINWSTLGSHPHQEHTWVTPSPGAHLDHTLTRNTLGSHPHQEHTWIKLGSHPHQEHTWITLGSHPHQEHTWITPSPGAHLDHTLIRSTLGSHPHQEHTWITRYYEHMQWACSYILAHEFLLVADLGGVGVGVGGILGCRGTPFQPKSTYTSRARLQLVSYGNNIINICLFVRLLYCRFSYIVPTTVAQRLQGTADMTKSV